MNQQEKIAHEQGTEAGLSKALSILEGLAEVMLEREAQPGKKPNYARRIRIKAYQVAGHCVRTQLARQRRTVAGLETSQDQRRDEQRLRTELENLAL